MILTTQRANVIVRLKPDGTRWHTGGEVKGKLANGVGSHYSHTISERGVSSITNDDAHTSAASSRLNWRLRRFKWTRLFRQKMKSSFCACAITFQTQSTLYAVISRSFIKFVLRYTCVVPRVYRLAQSYQNLKKIFMRTVCYLTFRKNINTVTPPNTIHFAHSTRSKSLLVA
jgi:hypothetical protein